MYKLKNEIEKVEYYYVNENLLYFTDNLYFNFNLIFPQNVIGGSLLGSQHILINENNRQLIIDKDSELINDFSNNVLINDIVFQDSLVRIASIDTLFNEDGSIICNWLIYNFKTNTLIKDLKIKTNYCNPIFFNEELIIFQEMNILRCYKVNNGAVLWEYNNEFAHNATLGIFNDFILLPTKNHTILSINIPTGKIVHKWRELPNINKGSKWEGLIPESQSFVLDKKQSKLIGAFHKYYIDIDLISHEINYIDITSELKKYHIIFIKQLNDNPFTEVHIFLTAMMEQTLNDKKWSYDCLFALNRNTLKIDWIYKFEKQNLGTHIPKMTHNKLFQLDNNNSLHIFDKTRK
ncbi:hypothetical protein [Lacinutrix algicola]|uniref:hypothetical protein n=1 Tax=Lacinutrix algicola TaxID=342954 RepID=UPI0006E26DCF|nr:hypothetical protein [Lacinutrix algicola]